MASNISGKPPKRNGQKGSSVDWSRSSDLWVTEEIKLLWAQRSSD
jgi:hypothetical protein